MEVFSRREFILQIVNLQKLSATFKIGKIFMLHSRLRYLSHFKFHGDNLPRLERNLNE